MENNKITSEDFDEAKQSNKDMVNNNEKTKKKSNAQKIQPILIVIIVSLLIVLTCVLIAYYQVYNSSEQNANILEGVYASSYYSMVDNVNNLAVDISKYSNLTTTQSKLSTLQDMMLDCNYILAGLSVLPIEEQNVVSATKFFNQVNGLCEAYSVKLTKGLTLTSEEELMFDKIGLVVGKIKANFNEQSYGMYDTGFNFVDATFFDDSGMNELSAGMGDLTADSIEYPSMIFDGPFSTALETKQVKGLTGKEISKEQAKQYLTDTVLNNPRVVGVGEIGLDYHYARETRDAQIKLFEQQLDIAKKYALPVAIHTRDAEADTADILTGDIRGVMHCFTSSWDLAKKMLDRGFFFSASGILTFKNADDIRETFAKIPNDRIVIETDAPYCAPVPYRGKTCEPAMVTETARVLAQIKNLQMDDLETILMQNVKQLYPKIKL